METILGSFIFALRRSGVRISVAETLEAFEAVRQIGFEEREMFRDALAAVLAKSLIEKRIFWGMLRPLLFARSLYLAGKRGEKDRRGQGRRRRE